MYTMEVGERLTLTVHDVAYGGRGVGRHEGRVVFVHGVLPGETVEVEVVRLARNFAEARLLGVSVSSGDRIAPACPLAGVCPGCRYQHATYEAEVRIKQSQFQSLLQRLGGLDPALCAEPVGSPLPSGYRNKIVLHAWREGGPLRLGYFSEDNTTVLDVPACPLSTDAINRRLAELRGDGAFLATLRTHNPVTLRETAADGVMHWVGRAPDGGRPWLTERTAVGDIRVPRGGFFQVNAAVAGRVVQAVADHLRSAEPDVVLDAYGGVGVFAFAAARMGIERVFSVDADGQAIEAGRENAARFGLGNVEFLSGPAGRLTSRCLHGCDPAWTTVIADPPRAGLEPSMLSALVRRKPAGIVYVSCAADTLARDLAHLCAAGYRVLETRLYDMFPRTAFFESVTRLAFR
jgi:23S rRNA (uracil1939-C5)-methyltransferase